MLVVYDSMTGNVKRFVNKLPPHFTTCPISEYRGNEKFILITYTFDFGQVSDSTKAFLQSHHGNMVGVASSGNKNWGDNFALAAHRIGNSYGVPIILKFELAGTEDDINKFVKGVKEKCQKKLQNGSS